MRDAFPYPYTVDDADRWLAVANKFEPPRNFAIVVAGVPAGGVGLVLKDDVYRRTAEIGYWLGEDYWGRGIATSAVRATVEYAFATFDIGRLFAGVFAWNPASARGCSKKPASRAKPGCDKAITKDGRTCDELVYACVRGVAV